MLEETRRMLQLPRFSVAKPSRVYFLLVWSQDWTMGANDFKEVGAFNAFSLSLETGHRFGLFFLVHMALFFPPLPQARAVKGDGVWFLIKFSVLFLALFFCLSPPQSSIWGDARRRSLFLAPHSLPLCPPGHLPGRL